jgi:ataxia telangiectasia mutated family protein
MQTGFEPVLPVLKDLLRTFVSKPEAGSVTSEAQDLDFAPIQSSSAAASADRGPEHLTRWHRHALDVTLAMLTVVPSLQSGTAEPTRDKDLSELFLGCDETRFALVGSVYLAHVRRRALGLGGPHMGALLQKLEGMLTAHTFARAERVQLLAVDAVDALLPLAAGAQAAQTRALCHWLAQALGGGRVRSWRMRERVARFFDVYLARDPRQQFWQIVDDAADGDGDGPAVLADDLYPSAILPRLGMDEDIRVRFRVAGSNARLLGLARAIGHDAMQSYDEIKQWLTSTIDR